MPYIFLVPSDQCPWKLLLQLQLFLLALRSSAVTAWFRMVLPRPEQQEWQVWLIPPSRQNLPCSKGWKILFGCLLWQRCSHAVGLPRARAGTIVPSQESFAGVLLSAHTGNASLSPWNGCWICLCFCCCLVPLRAGLEQKWEAELKVRPSLT